MPGAEKFEWHFHDLRHEPVERGLSLPEVALISGHGNHRMLLRYTHPQLTRSAWVRGGHRLV